MTSYPAPAEAWTPGPQGRPPVVRRRRRRGRALLVLVLVVLGLLVAADRIGVAVADSEAATLLQRAEHLDHKPDVSITGFPFLTQLISGHYGEIDVTANDLTLRGNGTQAGLRLDHLQVALHDVQVSRDFSTARSDYSTATALVRYADLSTSLGGQLQGVEVQGVEVQYAGNGRVSVTRTVTVAGIPMTATGTAGLSVASGALTFTAPQISVDGQAAPAAVADYFAAVFQAAIPLGGLPFGVHVDAVTADAAGVSITLSAHGLTYHR